MQTNKQKKKPTIRRPQVRSLKIYGKYQERAYHNHAHVPEIRLCGQWLDKLGFCKGRRVTITTMNGILIVTLQIEPKDTLPLL